MHDTPLPTHDDAAAAAYPVSVREFCAFTAKAGDLDLRFTPSPSADEGIAGHQAVASRRPAGWQAEAALELLQGGLRLRGRADGLRAVAGERAAVEEVKTHRGPLARLPANHRALHRAQAETYAWMLAARDDLPEVEVRLVYLDVDRQTTTLDAETLDRATLRTRFEARCERLRHWAEAEQAHRARRDAALRELPWPHDAFRPGQRPLATAVYNAARSRRHLLAQAPTGIGKTMATLFPMLKAMPGSARGEPLDRLFFLTAKTPGRQLALDALSRLAWPPDTLQAAPARPLRVLALVARDKACEHPDRTCHGDACPLARGFWDRLPAARAAAADALAGDPADVQARLRTVALAHEVCPYHLGQEMARWADVVVGDYNHQFDVSAHLHALTVENRWRAGVLVDEAHNLVPRARDMYTAELTPQRLAAAKAAAPPTLRAPLARLVRAWHAVARADDAAPYSTHDAVPEPLLEALRRYAAAVGDALVEHPQAVEGEPLQLHFEALHFAAMADRLDHHGQFDVTRRPPAGRARTPQAVLCVRNVVPAPHLAERFAAAQAVVLFSATLTPPAYHRTMLGLPEGTPVLDVASPFDAGQLQVHVAADVSTRWADRAHSLDRVAAIIAAQYHERPGNYLAYFSSFDYLGQVADRLAAIDPALPLRRQARGMDEPQREAWIASFVEGGAQVGFAVLGGAFGEGIDLPGTRLIGAFVVTLGLPQVNPVNEALKARLEALFGDGQAYAYLYPGLQKVVQAAGRVIRTPDDRGVLHLIDDRYRRPAVRALLPSWWGAPRLRDDRLTTWGSAPG